MDTMDKKKSELPKHVQAYMQKRDCRVMEITRTLSEPEWKEIDGANVHDNGPIRIVAHHSESAQMAIVRIYVAGNEEAQFLHEVYGADARAKADRYIKTMQAFIIESFMHTFNGALKRGIATMHPTTPPKD